MMASIYTQDNPNAIIASIIDTTPGHPERVYDFLGLPRQNYGFRLDEIDGAGLVLANYAKFAVVPGEREGTLCRADEQYQVGTTAGFVAGATSFVFDGASSPGTSGSTLSVPYTGKPTASSAAFTLAGVPKPGDYIRVDFSLNPAPGPMNDYSVETTVIGGWGLTEIIADLKTKIDALVDNTLAYSLDGNNGLRVRGFDNALLTVFTTIIGGLPGETKPDFVGWDIVPSELTGRGILVEGLDYSWDKETATFQLLQPGDILTDGTYWNFKFNCEDSGYTDSYPTIRDFGINRITETTTLDHTYFGKKLICEPVGVYMEVNLPLIDTIPEGREMMVEVGGEGLLCVKFIPAGGAIINYLRGAIYAMAGESFSIYKYIRDGVHEWRISAADGNFRSCGQTVGDDQLQPDLFNKQALDGTIANVLQYARVYNEIVLNLPINQLVDFDAWSTGKNKYFFSRANSADIGNAGKFRFPDRRGLFERNNQFGKAGDWLPDQLGNHMHELPFRDGTPGGVAGWGVSSGRPAINWGLIAAGGGTIRGITSQPARQTSTTTISFYKEDGISLVGGTETNPVHYLINRYILL